MSVAQAWGARPGELERPTPAEALMPDPDERWIRAVDVAAPPELVWRWVCQLRAAPYSYDRLDNLGRRSPQELTPGLDALEVGQRVMTIFELRSFSRGQHLTVLGASRLPLVPTMAVSYVVAPGAGGGSRMIMDLLVRETPLGGNPVGRAALTLLRAGDLVMARRQLLNLAELAERDARR